ncbi:MAG: hypothetical protein KJP08_03750 [Gammaproteobacteria bacterium]|nr:hypothetical protein [Gammaproteobacteria bacterium]NNF48287.1 hypothetical protein [Woeseiaceae bacterium]MBT8093901.1 hypothetical protein [Gammaproteobacteria bacterium]MBT8104471.1 hypothetical protein [Gammaproteobacteria bacterium]NNK24486.1 hypothetical protein [Woeseiaceae bacterium]
MRASRKTLVVLAAITWFFGGFVLLAKGVTLASGLRSMSLAVIVPVIGVAIGLVKTKYLFNHFCERNLRRIAELEAPRIWQFFRPGFFLALVAMILTGALLSRLALASHPARIFVVGLDIALAVALLGSGLVFFRHRVADR